MIQVTCDGLWTSTLSTNLDLMAIGNHALCNLVLRGVDLMSIHVLGRSSDRDAADGERLGRGGPALRWQCAGSCPGRHTGDAEGVL